MSLVFSFFVLQTQTEKIFQVYFMSLSCSSNPKEQSIEFTVVSPISRNQMDLSFYFSILSPVECFVLKIQFEETIDLYLVLGTTSQTSFFTIDWYSSTMESIHSFFFCFFKTCGFVRNPCQSFSLPCQYIVFGRICFVSRPIVIVDPQFVLLLLGAYAL